MYGPKKKKYTFLVRYIDSEGKAHRFTGCGRSFVSTVARWMNRGLIDKVSIKRNKEIQ